MPQTISKVEGDFEVINQFIFIPGYFEYYSTKKTYSRIPFYIGMPMSTLDMSCPSGDDIPIEERPPGYLCIF